MDAKVNRINSSKLLYLEIRYNVLATHVVSKPQDIALGRISLMYISEAVQT